MGKGRKGNSVVNVCVRIREGKEGKEVEQKGKGDILRWTCEWKQEGKGGSDGKENEKEATMVDV